MAPHDAGPDLTPLFVAPYRKIGQMQQNLTRQSMDHNAQMNSTMTERFNVSGALLVKLFGRQNDEVEMFSERAEPSGTSASNRPSSPAAS